MTELARSTLLSSRLGCGRKYRRNSYDERTARARHQRALRSKGARSNLSSYLRHIALFHSVGEG